MRNTEGVVWGRFGASDKRIVTRDGQWFFFSREGEKGPYNSHPEAERALTSYVQLMEILEETRST